MQDWDVDLTRQYRGMTMNWTTTVPAADGVQAAQLAIAEAETAYGDCWPEGGLVDGEVRPSLFR